MRPLARLGFGLVLAATAALVSGCESLENLSSLLDTKTKLPGERKPVFPEGVPGVTPGVPPEMVKGYREPAVEPPSPAAALAEEPQAAEAKQKPKPKPKPHAIQTAAKPQPAPVAAGKGRLILVTSEGGPFSPSGVLRVDADLTSDPQPRPKAILGSANLSGAEQALASDRTAWFWLVVVGEALVVSVVLLTWAQVAWGRWQALLVATPVLTFFGIAVADQAARLLPNLL